MKNFESQKMLLFKSMIRYTFTVQRSMPRADCLLACDNQILDISSLPSYVSNGGFGFTRKPNEKFKKRTRIHLDANVRFPSVVLMYYFSNKYLRLI